MKPHITLGLENLVSHPPDILHNKCLGLLCNPASVDHQFTHASVLINKCFKGQLKALFSPQHGFYAEKQDNMVESDHFIEPVLNIPVFSLYGKTRIPTQKMFDPIDVLIVDIQDVGTRVYTFVYTVSYCMEMAARLNKKVVILDRPNPIGGLQIEGNILSSRYSSFVGRYPVPMRHGLTIGEICQFINTEYGIHCDLTVVPMTGWKRWMYWQDTNIAWVAPSPNLPTPVSAMVYPGQVIFEGTNVSEGRGTTLPFEQFGAPYMDCNKILSDVSAQLKGICLRKVNFEPTSGKWQGSVCHGFQIHVTSKEDYRSYETSLILLQSIMNHHADAFSFKDPPYEYEYKKIPIDLILGSRQLRKKIEKKCKINALSLEWQTELNEFKQKSRGFYLYDSK